MKDNANIVLKKTALYRHYDYEGKLLYVGVSLSPASRTSQHSRSAHWFRDISRIDVEWYDDREKALDAERIAIKNEQPTHNIWGALRQCPGMSELHTPSEIIAYVGHERAAQALGVPVSTVLRYRWRTHLPAAWLDALENAAMRDLPREAFSFKRADQDRAAS